jgi:hypothetical protein
VVAVAVLAAVVTGVMLRRGKGSPHGGADVPSATNLPVDRGPTSDSNPANKENKPSKPRSQAAPLIPPPAVKADVDAIVGCYQWFNNAPVVIRTDGTMLGGPFTGRWRLVSAAQHAYTFTWPEATDTVTISSDQRSLSGGNQYGYPVSGTRNSGSSGLVGTWRWPNGVPVIVYPDGKFSAATFRGTWQAIDASRGIYALRWPNPVDSVTLSADGSHVSGTNQYGVAISGTRTESCTGN